MDITIPTPAEVLAKFKESRFNIIDRKNVRANELLRALGRQFPQGEEDLASFILAHNLQIWVYRCTNVIASAFIRAVPKDYLITKKGAMIRREVLGPDAPSVKLKHRPNRHTSGAAQREKLGVSLSLTGMFHQFIDLDNLEAWHLRSDRTEIIMNEAPNQLIDGYEYTVNGALVEFKPEEVLSFKYENPNSDVLGLPPLKAAVNSVNQHLLSSKWNLNFFKNAATPLGILTTDYNFRNDEEVTRVRKQWAKLYSGYKNSGATAVLGGGLKFQALNPSHVDIGLLEILDNSKMEIGAAFGVPPIYLNDKATENYSNLREYQRMLWISTMIPKLILLEGFYDQFLNPLVARQGEQIITLHDLAQVEALREDIVKEAEAGRVRIMSAQETPDEARERRGLPAYPDGSGEKPMIQMSMVGLDQLGDVLDIKRPATGNAPPKSATKRGKVAPFDSAEAKFSHWSKTKGIKEDNEDLLSTLCVAVFADWQEEMLENLGAEKSASKDPATITVEEILFDAEAGEAVLGAAGGPVFEEVAAAAGSEMMGIIGAGVAFDVHDPLVSELLSVRTQRFAEGIASRSWDRMKLSLDEGIKSGETTRELAARVRENMGREIANARTIARTEILPCYEGASREAMRQSKVVKRRGWLSAFSEKTRDDHADGDGQEVGLDEDFIIGGESLAYPGDPAGRPDNIINCLCTTYPVVEGD